MAPLKSNWWRDAAALQNFMEEWSGKLRDMEKQEVEEFLAAKEHHDPHDTHDAHDVHLEEPRASEAEATQQTSAPSEVPAASVEPEVTAPSAPEVPVASTEPEMPAPSCEVRAVEPELPTALAEPQVPAASVEPELPAESPVPPVPTPEVTATELPNPTRDVPAASVEPKLPPASEAPAPVPEVQAAPPESAKTESAPPAEKVSETAAPKQEDAEKHEKAPMDPEAVRAAAQKASDVLGQLLQKPLEYEVREALPCYADPDSTSKELRTLPVGQVVQGYPGGGWLKLQQRGWAHIGRSLALSCLVPSIRGRYLEAIDLTWPGFSGLLKPGVKVIYIVEWRCRKSGAAGHTVCHKTHEVVSNMPPGKMLEIHVAVRLRGALVPGVDAAPEVRFAGPWVEAQTLNPRDGEDDEDAEACLDPFGTARAGCLDCNCYGFFWRPGLEEGQEDEEGERMGLNADPDTIKCIRRCGDPFATHTRAGTPQAEKLLDSRPARSFLVAYSRVFVRSKRSTTGDAIGAVKQGTEISGCTEGRWLHLTRESAQAVNAMPKGGNSHSRYVDAWVLMDGSHIGIASDLLVPEELAPPELRERAQKEEEEKQKRREEVAKKNQERKAQLNRKKEPKEAAREPDSEDEVTAVKLKEPLQGLMEVIYNKSVEYLILKPQLPIHRRPSTSSRTLGQLKRGQIVSGWPQESWLLLAEPNTTPKSSHGGWILVDASPLNLGLQAQAQQPVPRELRPFSEAVVVEWSKFPARHVEYQVEWADESEKDNIKIARHRETMTMARVHELPSDARLIFRLIAKVYTAPSEQGGEIFAEAVGPWEEAETGATIEKLEEGNLCVDPLANLRGRCMDCACHGFVLAEYGERPRTGDTLEEVSCRRCSCSCTRHFIIGEFHYRNPSAASVKKPPVHEAPRAALPALEAPRPLTWRVEDGEGIQFVLDKVGEAHTLYETLGVSGDADKAMIRQAYRQVSLSIHPDKVGHLEDLDLQKQAENAFKVVSSAYEILNDDKKRGEYDRKLRLTGATFGSRSGGRFNLTNIAFLKKFLSKERGGFGWDLSAKPPGDWEEQAPGVYVRGSGKPKEAEEASET